MLFLEVFNENHYFAVNLEINRKIKRLSGTLQLFRFEY